MPAELGGAGLRLNEVRRLQQRLAYVAPATAVAVNMHLYWTGLAADLARFGDDRCRFILEQAADGHVFAAGHGEAGNDLGLFASTTQARAVPTAAGSITGRKVFGSLSPVWSYLGFHAMDTSDPANPTVIHGFLPRDAAGYRIEQTWDALGMRATASHDTVFDGAFVPDELVPVVTVPAPPAPTCSTWRCWPGACSASATSTRRWRAGPTTWWSSRPASGARSGSTRSDGAPPRGAAGWPRCAWRWRPPRPTSGGVRRVGEGVDHGLDWPVKIVAAKHFAVARAFEIVDTALDMSGGSGLFKRNRIEQLFRDVRLGRIHPANRLAVYEIVGKAQPGPRPRRPAAVGVTR